MKKLLYLLLFIPLVFACSDDDNDNTPSEPANFYEAHNGVWIATTFYETINNQLVETDGYFDGATTYFSDTQKLLDIYDEGWIVYYSETSSGCWSHNQNYPHSGSSKTYINTANELYAEHVNMNASDMFSGDELQDILDAGYTTVSVAQSYLGYDAPIITYALTVYAGTFEEQLGNILSTTFEKQSSNSFSVCSREMSSSNISGSSNISVKTKMLNL